MNAGVYLSFQLVRTVAPVEVELVNGDTFKVPPGRILLTDPGAAERAIANRLVEVAPEYNEDARDAVFQPFSTGIFDVRAQWERHGGRRFNYDMSQGFFRGGALKIEPTRG